MQAFGKRREGRGSVTGERGDDGDPRAIGRAVGDRAPTGEGRVIEMRREYENLFCFTPSVLHVSRGLYVPMVSLHVERPPVRQDRAESTREQKIEPDHGGSVKDSAIVKVLYVVGAGRSGSTLLARAVGAMAGYCCSGEPYYLWKEGPIEDRRCECGAPFSRCDYWRAVMARVEADTAEVDPHALERVRLRINRTRDLPVLAIPGLHRRRLESSGPYPDTLAALYHAMADEAGAKVLVDASKLPSHGLTLRELPGLELYVLHLVRDPRGVVNSWRRKRFNPASGQGFRQMGSFKTSLLWGVWNLATELLLRRSGRYLRVRYEDWVDRPVDTLESIMALVDEPVDADLLCGRTLRIPRGHTLGGNPSRFGGAEIQLREDLGWRSELSRWWRWSVPALLWPFMLRYGYLAR